MEKIKITLTEQCVSCVIIEAPTGVIYTTQAGGTACGQPEVEGYLVPLDYFEWELLGVLFRDHWNEMAQNEPRVMEEILTTSVLDQVDRILSDEEDGARDGEIKSIEAKLRRDSLWWGEAWLPITCTYGIGWLTWPNSD